MSIEIFSIISILNRERDESQDFPNHSSGAAVLLEIAKTLRKDVLNNIDVIFLWCGGKITGNRGLKAFLDRHVIDIYQEYDLNRFYCLNIDKVGENIGLFNIKRIKKKELGELDVIIEATAKNMKFPLSNFTSITSNLSNPAIINSFTKRIKKYPHTSTLTSNEKTRPFNYIKESSTYEEQLNNCVRLSLNILESLDMRVK
ncbi:MAG: hypothetical protein JW891_14720 [Candidatus Lokiarchaeota archaeon]|nr:hypothetical protein [Candidatus Lokiarchaeota archaeon]